MGSSAYFMEDIPPLAALGAFPVAGPEDDPEDGLFVAAAVAETEDVVVEGPWPCICIGCCVCVP